MSLGLKLETCEILLSYAIVYRRPPSCFYCCGCCAHVLPCTLALDMRTPWLLCMVICPKFDPNNTSSNSLTVEINRAFQSVASWVMGLVPRVYKHSTPIWPLLVSGMFELRKNSAFLHDLEAYHELKSIQISFEEAHSYPKLFCYFRGAK